MMGLLLLLLSFKVSKDLIELSLHLLYLRIIVTLLIFLFVFLVVLPLRPNLIINTSHVSILPMMVLFVPIILYLLSFLG